MDKAATGLAAAALIVAGAGLWMGVDARARVSGAEARARQASLEAGEARKWAEEARGVAETEAAARKADARVEDLSRQVAKLAAARPGEPGGNRPAVPGTGEPAAASEKKPSGPDPALLTEFRDLRKKYFKGEASDDEQKRYWELVKMPGVLDGVLAEMEAAVAGSPEDVPARLELAQGYLAKLFTVPPGPEMGLWASKAETQWKEVLTRDDKNWEARVSLATTYSRYPEFLNKTPDAIREFETVRKQQEAGPAEPKQARVYTELGNLYKRAGNPAKQREALEEGLRRHPESEDLQKALAVLNAQ